jgi:hypothetical protein
MLLLFSGLLSSIKKDEVIKFKAYTGEYGLYLANEQTKKVKKQIELGSLWLRDLML